MHQIYDSCWSDSLCIHEINKLLITVLKHASPLRNQLKLLTKINPIKHNADSRLGFPLHTITGFHRPSLTHYYGFICHLTLAILLSHLLNNTSNHFELDTMPGFPSYCTSSLLEIPPSNTALVWLSIGRRAILDAYPPIPPKQVTVSCVPLTSYGFLQTSPLANDALAIQIIFPLVGVIRHLSAYRVCQLRWANKKPAA